MKLPSITGSTNLDGKYFYFAADKEYFDLYGKALALSLKARAPWAKIHVHLYNPTPLQLSWCDSKNISYTHETVIIDNVDKLRTYYACVRFIRIPEIFKDTALVLSLDCDQLANNTIPETKFDQDTNQSRVTIKKNGESLASAIAFGRDNFRKEYMNRLIKKFDSDEIYWFLDQDILNDLIREKQVLTMGFDWTGTKMTEHQMMWTAKGERKNTKEQYVKLLAHYNSIV